MTHAKQIRLNIRCIPACPQSDAESVSQHCQCRECRQPPPFSEFTCQCLFGSNSHADLPYVAVHAFDTNGRNAV